MCLLYVKRRFQTFLDTCNLVANPVYQRIHNRDILHSFKRLDYKVNADFAEF